MRVVRTTLGLDSDFLLSCAWAAWLACWVFLKGRRNNIFYYKFPPTRGQRNFIICAGDETTFFFTLSLFHLAITVASPLFLGHFARTFRIKNEINCKQKEDFEYIKFLPGTRSATWPSAADNHGRVPWAGRRDRVAPLVGRSVAVSWHRCSPPVGSS